MAAKRILKNVDVTFISLVDKGANQKQIIWKSAHREGNNSPFAKTIAIVKTDEEKRMVYGTVYSPDEVDSQGDTMAASEIEKAAHAFMKAARTGQVDKQHSYQAGDGFIAESWINKGSDPLFPSEKEGSWHVGIKVESDETWEAVKKGEIGGLSLAGQAVVEEVSKSAEKEPGLIQRMRDWFDAQLRSGGVEKDFYSEYNRKVLSNAAYSLYYALDEILYDYTVADKKAALIQEAEKFITFLNSQSQETMAKSESTPAEKAAETTTAATPEAPALQAAVEALQKSVQSLTEKIEALQQAEAPAEAAEQVSTDEAAAPTIDDLQKQLTEASAKIEQLMKASPGRQSTEGRSTTEKAEEKGIRFFAS